MRPLTAVTLGIIAVIASQTATAAPALQLEKVIIVERHGVRAPTKSDTELSQYSRDPWRIWPVAPGELTKQGADGAEAMGAALKAHYTKAGLLRGMPDDVFVWADIGDTRTVQSGDAVARGLHTAAKALHRDKPIDLIFEADDAGVCAPSAGDISRTLNDSRSKTPVSLNQLGPKYDAARTAMAELLYPGINTSLCEQNPHGACVFVTGENRLKGDGWDTRLTGPLATGSSLSENLLLEYAQGFDAPGWGRADAKHIAAIMELHNLYARLMRRNPVIAGRRGAFLAQNISDLLNNTPASFASAAPVPANAKLVLFLGHDTNISNLGGIYGLDWQLDGQPDDTAPNTALAFELWRDARGAKFVRLRLFYQTLEQLRQPGTTARGSAIGLAQPLCQRK
ncbi:MAG: histidine-type phosphatase, partial [Rhizomicrobium sp.]